MDDTAIRAVFTQLLQVCITFTTTAEPGADIRDYGLTPALLGACRRALGAWHEQPTRSNAAEYSAGESAAWHAYMQMRDDHGEDFR